MNIQSLYQQRFSKDLRNNRKIMWQTIVSCYLQKYIKNDSVVVDLGAGYCEFINSVKAKIKYAVVLNPDIFRNVANTVKPIAEDCCSLPSLRNSSIDVVFSSNFLEHLDNKEMVNQVICTANRILKADGTIILLGPNIKYVKESYWDFFDHKVALTHESLKEILILHKFEIIKLLPRFLPYTTKGHLPINRLLIKTYLRFPLLYLVFGKQFLIIAKKSNH